MNEPITLKEMEEAIELLESEGYVDVKVTHCYYWNGAKY